MLNLKENRQTSNNKLEMEYDKKKYKIWNWKSPVILHWMINPGLVINDLILGQSVPKVLLIEREGDKPFYQRSLVPCPHCGTLHSGLKWSGQNKTVFKNWYGLYCDNCGGIIPPQRNWTSLLVLIITFPIWGWFRKSMKKKWLKNQPKRYENIKLEIPEDNKSHKKWIKFGLLWGLFMFAFSIIVNPLISNEPITWKMVLVNIFIWFVAGLGFGYIMKSWMNRKGKSTQLEI